MRGIGVSAGQTAFRGNSPRLSTMWGEFELYYDIKSLVRVELELTSVLTTSRCAGLAGRGDRAGCCRSRSPQEDPRMVTTALLREARRPLYAFGLRKAPFRCHGGPDVG